MFLLPIYFPAQRSYFSPGWRVRGKLHKPQTIMAPAKHNNIAVAAAALLCQLCLASATPGTANFFPATAILSPCSSDPSPPDATVYAAKASAALWAGGAACGKTYCVLCTGAADGSQPYPCRTQISSIYAVIQAQCSNCGAISLSQPGFDAIANPDLASTIKIDFAQVEKASRFPCA